jgi:predicted nucleotidyltransferase
MISSSFGLLDRDLEEIRSVLALFPAIERAMLFGSRAKGTHRPGSDVDIALCGSAVSFDVVTKVHGMLEEQSKMPYLFDVVDYTHMKDQDLKAHIDRVGVTIFHRDDKVT